MNVIGDITLIDNQEQTNLEIVQINDAAKVGQCVRPGPDLKNSIKIRDPLAGKNSQAGSRKNTLNGNNSRKSQKHILTVSPSIGLTVPFKENVLKNNNGQLIVMKPNRSGDSTALARQCNEVQENSRKEEENATLQLMKVNDKINFQRLVEIMGIHTPLSTTLEPLTNTHAMSTNMETKSDTAHRDGSGAMELQNGKHS